MRRLMVISAAVHFGLLIFFPLLPDFSDGQPLALEVYAVELVEVAPQELETEEVVEETEPEPVVERPVPEEVPIPEEPVRRPKPVIITPPPKRQEKTLEERIAERLKNKETARAPEQPQEQKPEDRVPSSSTKISAGKVADYYLTALQGKITRNWNQPSAHFTAGEEITVRISFTVLRSGEITGLRVERSSGWSTVDQSATQAVRNSAPFSKLPPTYTDDRLDVAIDFTVTQ